MNYPHPAEFAISEIKDDDFTLSFTFSRGPDSYWFKKEKSQIPVISASPGFFLDYPGLEGSLLLFFITHEVEESLSST